MKKIPKKEDQQILKDRFSISADELEDRMQRQAKLHKEPIQRAVAILEMAVDTVLRKLGVNIELGDIPAQMDQLGIIMTEETREDMAGLNGFFIFVSRNGDLIPHSWIGAAKLNSVGECNCEIHMFQDNRLLEIGGERLIK